MFMVLGPLAAGGNIPMSEDPQVRWIGRAIHHLRENGYGEMEPTRESVKDYARYVDGFVDQTILREPGISTHSYIFRANIPGKRPALVVSLNGIPSYAEELQQHADNGFPGFVLTSAGEPVASD
jgi:hypothetical protein